jgi:hypothetical protein
MKFRTRCADRSWKRLFVSGSAELERTVFRSIAQLDMRRLSDHGRAVVKFGVV